MNHGPSGGRRKVEEHRLSRRSLGGVIDGRVDEVQPQPPAQLASNLPVVSMPMSFKPSKKHMITGSV